MSHFVSTRVLDRKDRIRMLDEVHHVINGLEIEEVFLDGEELQIIACDVTSLLARLYALHFEVKVLHQNLSKAREHSEEIFPRPFESREVHRRHDEEHDYSNVHATNTLQI
mmetsp:Transcript_13254/g.18156  ORF Transcript_13254/g.18156 Transcript_13254/m.18156 type:complete len:111 (-) Transcript_13254:459-791(-)